MPQASGVRPQRFQQMGGPRAQNMMPGGSFGSNMHSRPGAGARRFQNTRPVGGQQPGAGQQGRGGAANRGASAGGKGGPRPMSYSGTAAVAGVPPTGASRPQVVNGAAAAAPAPGSGPVAPASSQGKADGSLPLDMKALTSASAAEQKQILGEYLFMKIHKVQPEQAGKITGMLLEIDNAEIVHMLESEESLKAKIDEAVDVLKAHQATSEQSG